MSTTTALAVTPNRRPATLATFHNGHGWSPSIWSRLLAYRGITEHWLFNDAALTALWNDIEELPEWQQAALVLTFDTGVIPHQAFTWAAAQLDEFEARLPSPTNHVNHVPAISSLLKDQPETPLFGVWGTSVSENPFDPWDGQADKPGSGIPLYGGMYALERHRHLLPVDEFASR